MALSPLGMSLMMQPQGGPPNRAQVNPTDVLGAFKLSTDAANTQYLAKLQQQNAMWGGLAGLGGAGILGTPALYKMYQGLSGPTSAPVDLGKALYSNGQMTGIEGVGPTAEGTAGAGGGAFAGAPEAGATTATSYAPETIGPSLSSWLAAPDAAAAGASGAAAAGAGTVAADLGATSALDAAAPAIAGGMSLADILPFLFLA